MRRLAVVVALVASACSFTLQSIPKDTKLESTFPEKPVLAELPKHLKVMTFNVHKEPAAKFVRGIRNDRALKDADLLILQEVPRWANKCSAACDAGKMLGFYTVYAPAHHHENMDIGVAVLSKAPIMSAEVIELPWHDVHFNAGRRAAMAVTIMQDGRPLTVYAVHLENRLNVAQRRRQMTPILEHAKRQPTPVIIAGDFNTNPFTWVSHWLPLPTNTQDERLEELVRSYGFDTPVTESGATHRYVGMKLDAIYTRGFDTRRFATAHAQDVSDHMALWAALSPRASTIKASRSANLPVASTTKPAAAAIANTAAATATAPAVANTPSAIPSAAAPATTTTTAAKPAVANTPTPTPTQPAVGSTPSPQPAVVDVSAPSTNTATVGATAVNTPGEVASPAN